VEGEHVTLPPTRARTRSPLLVAVGCALIGLATAAFGRAGAGTTRPADPYVRQRVDAEDYRFAITLSDSTDRIEGVATVRLRLLAAGLRMVRLDLAAKTAERQGRGMEVAAVTRGDAALAFHHEADRLEVTLDHPSSAGEELELVVRYAGIPAAGLEIKPNAHGDRTFFSDDWPDKAHQWLPTIDHIADKATMTMDVTAPAHYQVVSNGRLVETTDRPGGSRRTVWRESVPIAPWLFVLGVARFAVEHVGDYQGIPIETWVFAQERDAGFHDFAVPTRDVLSFFSERIGPFAYEKLANVQSDATGGGMEAASAIMYGASSVTGTRAVRWRNVVIHELAHQWFGDAVTESSWDDVWLSEGFATYFTLLFIEHAYGRDEFAAGLRSARRTVISYDTAHPGIRVVHDSLADMAQVTSALTYQKGAWTLHMLRQRIGDDKFWAGFRDYYARYRNGNASTTDFRRTMEQASGQDLEPFFRQWLNRAGVPRLEGTWRWDAEAKQVVVDLNQTQPGELYQLPVEIGITGAGGTVRIEHADLGTRSGHWAFASEGEPAAVVLDPDVRLLVDGRLERR
jgi:aminopeptidase N